MKNFILNMIEKYSKNYFTYNKRPFFASQIYPKQDKTDDVSILIQGPVSDFTLETVKFYKLNYPNAQIVVSTWENSDTEQYPCEVVKSKLPEIKGPRNINYQIVSTRNGLKKINSKYVIKTRSDQRMYGFNCLLFLKNIDSLYPDRIAGIDFGTHLDAAFMFNDFFIFGKTSDLIIYANAKLIDDTLIEEHKNFFKDGVFLSERYLFKEYVAKKGWEPEFKNGDLENYYRALAKFAITIDNDSIDLYWPKYNKWEEHRHRSYTHHGHCLPFKEWLNFYVKYEHNN